MSLVPFTFKNVELKVVTINGKPWTRAKEICRALEYKRRAKDVLREHVSIENKQHKIVLQSRAVARPVSRPKDSQKYDIYINEEGIKEIVLKSKQPKAAEFAEHLGINVHKHKYTSKENDSIEIIMKTFHGEKMERQFKIGNYRIDLYFPEHKIAVECDEFDHIDRDINYEIFRQKFIEEQLQCTFVRYNPDDKDFDIALVLNKIYRTIIKK